MSKKALRPDEIGYWSEVKLDIVKKYAMAYSTIMANQKTRDLFGDIEEKATDQDIAAAFRDRLRTVAGFKYVPDPMPMRNSKGAVVYYLFFASQNKTGESIVQDIFNTYRNKGIP